MEKERELAPEAPREAADFETAVSLQQSGRTREAVSLYRRIVEKEPRHFEALFHLGQALLALGEWASAEEALRQAVAVRPQSADAQAHLGYVLGLLERYPEAIVQLTASLSLEPSQKQALAHLYAILAWLGRQPEMIAWLEKAVAADPKAAAAHQMLGSLLLGMGRTEDARRELELAVALEPRNGRFHLALSEAKTYAADDRHLAQMESLLGDAKSPQHQAEVQFALAKAYAEIGNHDRAFALLATANKNVRRKVAYDEKRMFATFEHAKRIFDAAFLRSRQGFGAPSERPLFIVGMPRSGSTLLEQILASHPAVHVAGESRAYIKACAPFVKQFPQDVTTLESGKLRVIAEAYLDAVSESAPGAQRVVDKMLSNFVLIGLIHLSLPRARFVHSVRDPVDTCLSCYATYFAESQPFAFDLGELGRFYRAYSSLMDHWRAVLPQGTILDVHYEKLVGDLEGETRRLLDFCGLPWNGACLEFFKTARPIWTASVTQVRSPITRRSIGRPRPDFATLAPLLAALDGDAGRKRNW